jgi:hypothetical protein
MSVMTRNTWCNTESYSFTLGGRKKCPLSQTEVFLCVGTERVVLRNVSFFVEGIPSAHGWT